MLNVSIFFRERKVERRTRAENVYRKIQFNEKESKTSSSDFLDSFFLSNSSWEHSIPRNIMCQKIYIFGANLIFRLEKLLLHQKRISTKRITSDYSAIQQNYGMWRTFFLSSVPLVE